jgi:glycerol uptake facilitator-like aquaporin
MGLCIDKKVSKSVFGFGCGASFAMSIISIGDITGSMLNPIRALAPSIFFGTFDIGNMWIYIAGPILGCAVGAATYEWVLQKKAIKNTFDSHGQDIEDDE